MSLEPRSVLVLPIKLDNPSLNRVAFKKLFPTRTMEAGVAVAPVLVRVRWRSEGGLLARRCHSARFRTRRHPRLVPRNDPPALVARLAEADVVVRELPGTGLVRASCGSWTSDEDLERLVAAV